MRTLYVGIALCLAPSLLVGMFIWGYQWGRGAEPSAPCRENLSTKYALTLGEMFLHGDIKDEHLEILDEVGECVDRHDGGDVKDWRNR